MQILKPLASLYSWAGQFEYYLVANHEDRFSRDGTHLYDKEHCCPSLCIGIIKSRLIWAMTRKTNKMTVHPAETQIS